MQKVIALILALALSLTPSLAWTGDFGADYMGSPLADFTVKTIDGGTFTLSEALKEKELVFINLWATWCGPCRMEFPYLEEAWKQYQDRVAVIALSVEAGDTAPKLTEFARTNGLTFPIGSDIGVGLDGYFEVTAIPTSVIVDRFGNVVWRESGAQTSTDGFTALFDWFLRETYTETRTLSGKPPILPTVEAASEAALADALNAPGGAIVFRNSDDECAWPMIPAEMDGRTAVAASNRGQDNTFAVLSASIIAQPGEALAFDFATSTESGCDALLVTVDGSRGKVFGGEHAWTAWIMDLAPGEHEISFTYAKDESTSAGQDCVWLDNVRLVSGEEADALRAALPVCPTAEEFGLRVASHGAKEIVFEGAGAGTLPSYFASTEYWIVPQGVMVEGLLTPEIDPEAAFFYSDYNGRTLSAWDCLSEDGAGYFFMSGLDTLNTTGYPWTEVYLYAARDKAIRGAMFFADEENVAAFMSIFTDDLGLEMTWRYADGSLPGGADADEDGSLTSRYAVSFADQNGDPVPGCIVNFCTDDACTPVVADENGVAVYEGAPFAYHLQVIRVPAGYAFDTAREFYADPAGGDISFTVVKE